MSVLSEALKRLMACEQPLIASEFTACQRNQLEQFARDTRLVEISKQGRRNIYRVLNRQSVLDFLALKQPLADDQLHAGLPARSRNIGKDRNSKKGQTSHDCWYLLMKAWDSECVWTSENGTFHLTELTERFGVAAMRISAGQGWQCNRPLLLVENQALFDCCDWLPDGFNGCLAYYAGQLSDVLLQWLCEQKRTDKIILFPDYDGIGLANYVRLVETHHSYTTVQFYWLPDWETKLAKFGNAGVWKKTRVQFENALQKLAAMNALTTDLSNLASLSQNYGKALEQESIWL
ncbi:MAG: hypothetical protein ACXWTY_12180 [Methylobacter sp.]